MSDSSPRKLLWWNDPVRPSKRLETGKRMMRNTLVWFAVVVSVLVVLVVIAN